MKKIKILFSIICLLFLNECINAYYVPSIYIDMLDIPVNLIQNKKLQVKTYIEYPIYGKHDIGLEFIIKNAEKQSKGNGIGVYFDYNFKEKINNDADSDIYSSYYFIRSKTILNSYIIEKTYERECTNNETKNKHIFKYYSFMVEAVYLYFGKKYTFINNTKLQIGSGIGLINNKPTCNFFINIGI